jgi:hypothetical protein
MIYKHKGKLLVSNLNIELIEQLILEYPTVEHFLKDVGISYIVLQNIRNGGSVKLSTIEKLLNRFYNLRPQDLIQDFKKDDYMYFNIDLTKFKPTQEDVADSVEYLQANQRTIHTLCQGLAPDKVSRIMMLIKRLVMEAAYYGIMLEKMNKSIKVIDYINKTRNKGDKYD